MVKYNWAEILPVAIDEAEKIKSMIGAASTLRGLFYILVTHGLLPNTLNAYKALSRYLTKERKAGNFPWSLLRDETRKTLGGEKKNARDLDTILEWAEDAKEDAVNGLTDAIDRIENPSFDYEPYVWEGQPKRVIMCLEKEALDRVVLHFTDRYKIKLNIMRGYSSATNMMRLAYMVNEHIKADLDVEVLVLTDFDPSGEDIARYVQKTLNYDYGLKCNVEKIILTSDQIGQYELPPAPAKRSDVRFQGFYAATGSDEVVELDAMVAIKPTEFERIIEEAIAEHFDEDIETDNEEQVSEARDKYIQDMNDINDELGDLINQIREKLEEVEI